VSRNPAFANECQWPIELGGDTVGDLDRPFVRGQYHGVSGNDVAQCLDELRPSRGDLDGNGEQSFGRGAVRIEKYDPVRTARPQQITHDPGADRLSGPGPTVVAPVTEIREHSGHPGSPSTSACVEDEEEFQRVFVDGRARGLDDVDVTTTHIADEHICLAVGEALAVAERLIDAELGGQGVDEVTPGTSGDEKQLHRLQGGADIAGRPGAKVRWSSRQARARPSGVPASSRVHHGSLIRSAPLRGGARAHPRPGRHDAWR